MFSILDFQTSKSQKYHFFVFFVGIYGMLINSKKSTFLKQAWPSFKLRLIANANKFCLKVGFGTIKEFCNVQFLRKTIGK